ncbi:MAG: phosphatidylserine decarboxylase family protein [Bacteroidales bacterium]|jgi:phosphatidylserine decarboxylase|nr:phosphatidylserine decarboxylase family protein [Bacteroidales bacterium]
MKIHREGYRLIMATVLLLVIINILAFRLFSNIPLIPYIVLILSLLKTGFFLFFFRSPVRPLNDRPMTVTAPADGKIVVIEEAIEKEYLGDLRLQISVFMSPLNVHCNRYPVSGIVREVIYHPGRYLVAWHPKSSELNERCTVVIETESGNHVVVRQIAGTVARRIVTYAKPGQVVKQGEELGFIKFGSRVDLFLPQDFRPNVSVNQKVAANTSVIGSF